MTRRIQHSRILFRLLSLGLVLMILPGAIAQEYQKNLRPDRTFFVRPKVGFSSYFGDNEKSPFNFNGDAYEVGTPWNAGLELGYQFSVPFSVGLSFSAGEYPVITQFPARANMMDEVSEDDALRSSIQAIGRYTFANAATRAAFYLNFGLTYSFGNVVQDEAPYTTEESGSAFGPLAGVGLDIVLSPSSSFFAEYTGGFHLDDEALDGTSEYGYGGVDVLGALGFGVKINFSKALTPPIVGALTCPTGMVVAGAVSNFSATTNASVATQPLELRWEFGDGVSASGASGTHFYTDPGTYDVMFFAMNEAGTATSSCSVTVMASAEIIAMSASKENVSICDEDSSVMFTANTGGSEPLTYMWDFGDGQSSADANPSHTYSQPGSYTVTLTLINEAGSDSRTNVVNVTEEGCFNCDISEMNTVFFDRNSSVLTEAGLTQLSENLEILQNCELNVRIEGYASRDERNVRRLSEDRAMAVKQFYLDSGIDESRMTDVGMGAGGHTTKKGAASQFRRVDTIPAS